jgi:hypothetical protein
LTDDRDEFLRHLIARYKAGCSEKTMSCKASPSSMLWPPQMRLYSVLSTIAAAISAVASAVAAYFAYLGAHH